MALASGGKILGLSRPVAAGAAALVLGVAYFWWRSRRASKSGTAADTSALAPSPAGDGTAGGMTDNFFITIQEQQETQPHGPKPHPHPHPKQHHKPKPRQKVTPAGSGGGGPGPLGRGR